MKLVRIYLNGSYIESVSMGGAFKSKREAMDYINSINIRAEFVATINRKAV